MCDEGLGEGDIHPAGKCMSDEANEARACSQSAIRGRVRPLTTPKGYFIYVYIHELVTDVASRSDGLPVHGWAISVTPCGI